MFDTDGSGTIDANELKEAMQSLGYENKNPTIYNLIQDLTDADTGGINFDYFLESITAKLRDKETREGIFKIFKLFDDDNSGSINLNNLKRIANMLGENMSAEDLREMIVGAADNGEEISFEEFYAVMTKKSFF